MANLPERSSGSGICYNLWWLNPRHWICSPPGSEALAVNATTPPDAGTVSTTRLAEHGNPSYGPVRPDHGPFYDSWREASTATHTHKWNPCPARCLFFNRIRAQMPPLYSGGLGNPLGIISNRQRHERPHRRDRLLYKNGTFRRSSPDESVAEYPETISQPPVIVRDELGVDADLPELPGAPFTRTSGIKVGRVSLPPGNGSSGETLQSLITSPPLRADPRCESA